MTLEEYRDFFLKLPASELGVLELRNYGPRVSLIVHRVPPFQVELVNWGPNVVVPAHRHPNIDAFEVFVDGGLFLAVGATEKITNAFIRRGKIMPESRLREFPPMRVCQKDWHGGKAGEHGASFWSIQEWSAGSKMTAARLDWEGPEI